MTTFIQDVAQYAHRQWDRDLPSEVEHESKRLLLNNLAAAAAAHDEELIRAVRSWLPPGTGSGRDATLLWHTGKAPTEQAALFNALQMELLDFNETHLGVILHCTTVIAPAALAEGEAWGASGAEVLKAIAIGIEIEIALAAALRPSAHSRGVMLLGPGAAGAAAVAGLLRKPRAERMPDALGIALASATGVWESLGHASHAYEAASACRVGIEAAYLAEFGVDAAPKVLEGWQGVLGALSDENNERARTAIAALGERWELLNMNYKLLPTETITQAPLQGLLRIAREVSVEDRASVTGIDVMVSPRVAEVEEHRFNRFGRPQTGLQAQFDMRFCVAAGWLAGEFGPKQKQSSTRSDEAVLALRDRIRLVGDPSISLHDGASVRVTLADGAERSESVVRFHGTLADPLSDQELAGKFLDVAEPVVASSAKRQGIVDAVMSLQSCDDIRSFASLLGGPDE